MKNNWAGLVGLAACIAWGGSALVHAQFEMPDMKQMSGIPRPVTDLPDHAISVRLIRGNLSNPITSFPVELHIGQTLKTAKTDEAGRAQFNDVPAGASVKALAVVDGERLESQEFAAPAQGGIRLLLVATDKTGKSQPAASPVSGQVAIGGQSRFVFEPGDEAVQVYYLLDITNNAGAPVNPPAPFMFQMPTDAAGTTLLEGSSPQATVRGTRVTVAGPFPPGRTLVQVACEIPSTTGTLQITQRFPAPLEQLAVIVRKVGETRLTSTQLASQREMTAEGERFIAATGASVPAGQPIVLTLEELPHHSAAPRSIALLLSGSIVLIGVWTGTRPESGNDGAARAADRKRLLARREKLLADLVRLETDHRNGRGDRSHYAARREQLITALEHIYGALDGDDPSPEPADRAGLAA